MNAPSFPEFLTTREVAEMLRVKQRRVYDLAASGDLPHTKATGKLLFQRQDVERWLQGSSAPGAGAANRRSALAGSMAGKVAGIVAGSHDPLLDWAIRASEAGLPSFYDGSLDGLSRIASGEAAIAGLHIFDSESASWNVETVRDAAPEGHVLITWARRSRGLLFRPDLKISGIDDIRGRKVIARQANSGGQIHFDHLLRERGIDRAEIDLIDSPARTEGEAASAVASGRADLAPGLEAMAAEYRLGFLPLATENYDLLVERHFWFEPAWQKVLAFTRSPAFAERAAAMTGYDVSDLGRVVWNGA